MFLKKLNAGALQLTLFIIIVIALLLFSFLLFVQTHNQLNLKKHVLAKTINISNYGVTYGLENELEFNDTLHVDLKQNTNTSLKLYKSHWGIFERIVSSSKQKGIEIQKIALVGGKQSTDDAIALYLEEHNKPLIVVGNTKIEGISFLPKRGVKSGNIAGQSYYGTKLIYGEQKLSKSLPRLRSNEIKDGFQSVPNTFKSIEIKRNDTIKNSFLNPLMLLYHNDMLEISNVSVSGHVIIQSDKKIIVEPSAILNDVLLIAPEVEISNNVKGVFQVFATKRISIGNYVEMSYPSSIVLLKESSLRSNQLNKMLPDISIGENTVIKGVVCYQGNKQPNNYNSQVLLKESTEVYGEVYCNQNLELRGSVFGAVYTSNFVINHAGSVYQNHLYNAEINRNRLAPEYVGIQLNNTEKEVAKWLY
ncbi:hypothetical protein [Pontimicrobium sp. IMCC45349]|uniref:hypothetical protein n=1 Tax=Pontimicrobium sp. IMCC45349 TaxID=3391574 RepID=UPI0039A21D1D